MVLRQVEEHLPLFDARSPAEGERNRTSLDASPSASLARTTDPQTSHDAAAGVRPKLAGCQKLFVETLRAMGGAHTAVEVATTAANLQGDGKRYNVETIRKRARECERLGWIQERGARMCRVNKSNATVYEVI